MFGKIMINKFLKLFENWLSGGAHKPLDELTDSELRDRFIARSFIMF
jgi:hypothetical protein